MSKDEKKKDKKKKKKKNKELLLTEIKIAENCKSKCCGKFEKGEHKRCKRCPMFDLIKKAFFKIKKQLILVDSCRESKHF